MCRIQRKPSRLVMHNHSKHSETGTAASDLKQNSNSLPNTRSTTQQKPDKHSSIFSPFNCCLIVVLSLVKGAYPEHLHVLYCHIKLAFFLTFYLFGSCIIIEHATDDGRHSLLSNAASYIHLTLETLRILAHSIRPVNTVYMTVRLKACATVTAGGGA